MPQLGEAHIVVLFEVTASVFVITECSHAQTIPHCDKWTGEKITDTGCHLVQRTIKQIDKIMLFVSVWLLEQ